VFTLAQTPAPHTRDAHTLHPPSIPVPKVHRVANRPPHQALCHSSCFEPTRKARQLESKVWLLCLGSPGVRQLVVLPQNDIGIPTVFKYHPFVLLTSKSRLAFVNGQHNALLSRLWNDVGASTWTSALCAH
jgi:hypothetical protein